MLINAMNIKKEILCHTFVPFLKNRDYTCSSFFFYLSELADDGGSKVFILAAITVYKIVYKILRPCAKTIRLFKIDYFVLI